MFGLKDIFRLMAIKNRYTNYYCRCRLCNLMLYPGERIYYVNRWASGKNIVRIYYCENCIKSKREVLNEVDTDSILYGIARVDSYTKFKKKDYTRYLRRKERENN